MRQPKVHDLKIDPLEFSNIARNCKLNEVRFDDRGFAQGDYLFLRETTYMGEQMRGNVYPLIYTGFTIMARVTDIHTELGMLQNWVVMSIKVVSKATGGRYA